MIDFVSIAMRDGMQGMLSFSQALWISDLVDARRNGRQEIAVGRGAQALFRAGDADEPFGLVVPRRHLFVRDRPASLRPSSG